MPKAEVRTLFLCMDVRWKEMRQTPQGQLFNNFVSGTVGGFVGTAINTPFDVRLRANIN